MLALIWNEPVDPSPLPEAYRAYLRTLHAPALEAVQSGPSLAEILGPGPFGELHEASVGHEQMQDRAGVLAFAQSVSWVAHRPVEDREQIMLDLDSPVVGRAVHLSDDRGSEMDGAHMTREVKLSSADRVLFPDDGITKGDLFSYYDRVADAIVPHLRDRPFTMKRWREGIAADSFFQKQAPKGIPDWLPTREFRTWPRGGKGESRLVDFPLVDTREALLWMVQMHCIDMNAWYSRVDKPDRPGLRPLRPRPAGRRTEHSRSASGSRITFTLRSTSSSSSRT